MLFFFSEEAHFHFYEYVIKQKGHIWSKDIFYLQEQAKKIIGAHCARAASFGYFFKKIYEFRTVTNNGKQWIISW